MSTRELIFLNYLSTVFENLEEAIVLCEVVGGNPRPILVNRSFYTITGYVKTDVDALTAILSDSSSLKKVTKLFRRSLQSHDTEEITTTITVPTGLKQLHIKVVPVLNSLGEATHGVIIGQDVTADHDKDKQLAELKRRLTKRG